MRRTEFLTTVPVIALAFGALPGTAAALPEHGRAGMWVRYVMGFGVPFQKQVGFGMESTPIATRAFIETQVGLPGGTCNANTARKAYIRADHFGGLLTVYPVVAYVTGSGSLLLLEQNQPPPLRLLDSPHLYPRSAQPVASTDAPVMIPVGPSRFTENAIPTEKHTTSATHDRLPVDGKPLTRFEIWRTPSVPLGVARVRATMHDMPPFELAIDSYGFGYRPEITESLDAARAMN